MADDNEVSIVIKAVNDASGVLKQIAADVKIIAQNSETLKDSLGKVSRAEKEVATTTEVTSDSFKDFALSVGKATAIAVAFGIAVKKAFDFAQEGAALERLRVTGTALARSFGVDMIEAVAKIKAASLGTLTAQQALLATNRALLLGISGDTDQLANLMQIAAIRGRALGLNTTESFDRIILGIGRLSTRILDDLGIVIDGEQAYADYGKSIGKTADQLTEAEKRIALTNAIITDGNKILADTGGVVEDNATSFERLTTDIADYGNQIKETFANDVLPIIKLLDDVLFAGQHVGNMLAATGVQILNSSNVYQQYADELKKAAEAQGLFIDNEGNLIKITQGSAGVKIELIKANFQLTESQFDAAKSAYELSEADKTAGAQADQLAAYLRKLKEAQDATAASIEDLVTTSEKLSFSQAAQWATETALAFPHTEKQAQAMRVQFGLLDMAVQKFQQDIIAAGKDGVISMNEFRDAFAPVASAQIAKLREDLGKGLVDLQADTIKKLNDLRQQYQDDLTKDNLGLTRDLEDIERDKTRSIEDLNIESAAKREDEDRKHKDKLTDIERDYQRDVDKIMRKFEMARLRALIDLDARALFEAEQQRDSDLKDAKDTAKDKRDDEAKEYANKLKDLDDYNKEKKDRIEKDYKRAREDAQRNYDRQRQDAKTADDNRRRDIQDDADLRMAQLAQDFEDQKSTINAQLGIIQTNYQDAYDDRVRDLLDFFDTNENILLALQAGTVTLSDLRSQFNATGGIPFGGVPFVPDPTQTPPPPPTHNCLPGYSWNPRTLKCEQDPSLVPGNNFVGGAQTPGSVVGTIKLEIVGDGNLAKMVRDSAANVFSEIIAE